MQNRNKKGFTLIELVVATLIIGLLAAVLVPNALGARARANGAAVQTFLKNLAQEMEFTYSDAGAYYPMAADTSFDPATGIDFGTVGAGQEYEGAVFTFGIQTFIDQFLDEAATAAQSDDDWPFPIDKPRDVSVAFKTDAPDAHSGYCIVARWNSRDVANYFTYKLTPDAGIQTLAPDVTNALGECDDFGAAAGGGADGDGDGG